MPLPAGKRFGEFEILSPLGEGGMGEVYRARDTKLGREVALKVLPESLALDPDRKSLMDREARILASLNHPHIAALYGVEEGALIMELVEGQTLAERVAKGPVPIDQFLKIARQIAEALEAAHEKGVIHLDLKPANIKLTPDGVVKILDFGLARGHQQRPAAGETQSTLTMRLASEGSVQGTPAYMSPEQARGEALDKRSDIWAFGAVLFELLAAKRAFYAKTVPETLASVINSPPRYSQLPAGTPPRIRTLIERCLEKDAKLRIRDMGDARYELEHALDLTAAAPRRVWPWIAIAALAVAGLAAALWLQPVPSSGPIELSIVPPEGNNFGSSTPSGVIAISPDGSKIVFVASRLGKQQLWIRALDSGVARPLPGTEGAEAPFWSPDSRFVAFTADRKLKRIPIDGGPPQVICSAPTSRGGTWGTAGMIVFSPVVNGPLFRVPAEGGEPAPITEFDVSRFENAHYWPQFLPDGRRFLYFARSSKPEMSSIQIGMIDRAPSDQPRTRLVSTMANAAFAPSGSHGRAHLIYLRGGALLAQPFQSGYSALEGEPAVLAEGITANVVYGFADFAASFNGILLYGRGGNRSARAVWMGKDGRTLGSIDPPAVTLGPRLSPDGSRLLVSRFDPSSGNADLWIVELGRNLATRFTFDPAYELDSIWSPDGREIVFASIRGGVFNLYRKPVTTSGEERRMTNSKSAQHPMDWSRDGSYLLYQQREPSTSEDLWVMPMKERGEPIPFARTEFSERHGQFSPSGRWIAYDTDETGVYQVYIRAFPPGAAGGAKYQISSAGGSEPRWRGDGKEIFYVSSTRKMMSVAVTESPAGLQFGQATELFDAPLLYANNFSFFYDVTSDGQRFLLLSPVQDVSSSAYSLILNWPAKLKK